MSFAKRYYSSFFLLIVGFAFLTRVWNLHEPGEYVFDEVYHSVTAKLIAQNDPRAFEWWNPPPEPDTAVDWLHPPLAKYTQALSILAFGENSFGWRFSSALFGTGVIALTLLLSLRLFNSHSVSLLAGGLASLDGLLLVMSRIAMNDIHVTFFILLTIWLYLQYRPELSLGREKKKSVQKRWQYFFLTALAGGLAVSTKWSGAFVILLLLGSEGVLLLIKLFQKHKNPLQKVAAFVARSITLIALVGLVYLTSYTQMFLQGKDSAHFLELFKQTWSYQTHLDATHPYQSKPMQWFLNTKPVWFWVQYDSDSSRSDIYALGNPLLFVLADTSLIGFLIWTLYTKGKKLTKPLILLFSAYGIVWLPWALSPRIMFFYHYTPAVPFLCIFFAWFLHSLWQYPYKTAQTQKVLRSSIVGMIALIALTAVLWFPHWTGIPMPTWFKNTVYFAVPSWK